MATVSFLDSAHPFLDWEALLTSFMLRSLSSWNTAIHEATLEVHIEIAIGTKYSGIFSFAIIRLLQKVHWLIITKLRMPLYFVSVAISR